MYLKVEGQENAPRLLVGLRPDNLLVCLQSRRSEMHLLHLTSCASQVSLACLPCAQHTRISVQLGSYLEFHLQFLLLTRMRQARPFIDIMGYTTTEHTI